MAGGNLDQPTDLYALADQIKALGSSVGGVQINTVLLWNDANYATLGAPEQVDMFGLSATDAHTAAVHFMSELATHGGGTTLERTRRPASISALSAASRSSAYGDTLT